MSNITELKPLGCFLESNNTTFPKIRRISAYADHSQLWFIMFALLKEKCDRTVL